jgi:glucose-1-phosphatase
MSPLTRYSQAARSIRIVCFDIGGVLVRHCRSWLEGCASAGLPVRHGEDCAELMQRRRQLSHLLTIGEIIPAEFFRRMSETMGGIYSPEEVERIHRHWLGEEYEGIADVLRRLIAAGRVDTGILSNTNGPHWERLTQIEEKHNGDAPGPAPYAAPRLPRHRLASHLLGMAKPSPDIYREFCSRTGYAPHEVLFFEDLPDNVAAAQQAGWHTVLVDHTGNTAAQVRAALEEYRLIE